MQNIEYKAELRDLPLARSIASRLGAKFVEQLVQTDTYFLISDGRLKKREAHGHPPEWIFYHRDNEAKARLSKFMIYSAAEAAARFGTRPLPVWIVVQKTRDVFMLQNVRIHLDTVERLGTFLEFEALVTTGHTVVQCHAAVEQLRKDFGPVLGEPVSASYSDLLAAHPEGSPTGEIA